MKGCIGFVVGFIMPYIVAWLEGFDILSRGTGSGALFLCGLFCGFLFSFTATFAPLDSDVGI